MIEQTLYERLCKRIDIEYAILSEDARGNLKDMFGEMARDAYDRGVRRACELANSLIVPNLHQTAA